MDRYGRWVGGRSRNKGFSHRRRAWRPAIETLEGRLCLSTASPGDFATTTVLDAPTIAQVGSPVLLTAHVRYNLPTIDEPEGTVEFDDLTTHAVLGTVNLEPSGVATFLAPPALVASQDTIRAVFLGGPAADPSQADAIVRAVDPSSSFATTTSLNTPHLTQSDEPLWLSAQVSYSSSVLDKASGEVEFDDLTTNQVLGIVKLDRYGATTLTVPAGVSGIDHKIRATFLGGPTADPSYAEQEVRKLIPQYGTTTTLDAPSNAEGGASILLTAHVHYSFLSYDPPYGSVEFDDLTTHTKLGTVKNYGSGSATLLVPRGLSAADHLIRATFVGGAAANASHADHLIHVTATPTSVGLVAPISVWESSPVTISATVTAAAGSVHGGSVTFLDGGKSIGSSPVNDSGMAVLTLSSPTLGAHSLTARFTPAQETGFVAGKTLKPTTLQVVTNPTIAIATTTTLAAALLRPGPHSGQLVHRLLVQFQAHVSSSAAAPPVGQVAFLVAGRLVARVPVGANGDATLAIPPLLARRRPVVAQFLGGSAGRTPLLTSQSPTFVTNWRALVRKRI